MKAQTLVIVGLNRIGCSIGLAVKKRLEMVIVGFDDDADVAKAALANGSIDQSERNLGKAAAAADILVITTSISELEKVLDVVGAMISDHTLVLDFSNLKATPAQWAQKYFRQGHYVGAMPVLATPWLDDGRAGPEAATADLFEDSLFAVMASADVDPEAVETAVNFGHVIGSRPYFIDPPEYDSLVQGTETLPGLMSAALFQALRKSSAWQDMLRFAGLPFSLTVLPLAHNDDIVTMAFNDREATLRWLEAMETSLSDLRQLFSQSEPDLFRAYMEEVSIERDKWLLKRRENSWEERESTDVPQSSLFGQMVGGFSFKGDKKKGD